MPDAKGSRNLPHKRRDEWLEDFVSLNFGQREFERWKRIRRIGWLLFLLIYGVGLCGFGLGLVLFLIFGAVMWLLGERCELDVEGVFFIVYCGFAGTIGLAFTWWSNEAKYRWSQEEDERERRAKKRAETEEPILPVPMARRVEASERGASDDRPNAPEGPTGVAQGGSPGEW